MKKIDPIYRDLILGLAFWIGFWATRFIESEWQEAVGNTDRPVAEVTFLASRALAVAFTVAAVFVLLRMFWNLGKAMRVEKPEDAEGG